MDTNCFGNSEAALILARILEKQPYDRRRILASFHEYNCVLNEIVKSNLTKKLKCNFLKTTMTRFRQKMNRYDGEVKTFSHNVVMYIYRKHLRSLQ